jgi:ATP-dependent Clp protease ATP-binding subunit ClpC
MTEKNEKAEKNEKNSNKIYDKFDKLVSKVVIWAQSASIDAKVDCMYPESFMIGILTTGAHIVNSALLEKDVDLDKCLKTLKKELSSKKKDNAIPEPNYEDLKISKQVVDACKLANKLRVDLIPDNSIGVNHMFLALLRTSDFLKNLFANEGVTEKNILELLKHKEEEAVSHSNNQRKTSKTSQGSALTSFCIDVTRLAMDNKLDPILAREKEMEMAITILCRRTKNNPILLGEPGVGKSAIVEGIAQRIVSGTVPKQLQKCKLYSLNLSSLVAGTKFRGEFEERIHALVKEIQEATDCILFIDEIHTLVGAGSASGGAMDASNILKPFLARNDLRCIGATTLDDYKKYFQKDGALTRRFQQVMVEEPNKEQMKQILAGVRLKLESYHNCVIADEAIDASISLCDRYLKDRNFPDKAIDSLDMACAKNAWNKDNSNKPSIVGQDIASVISEQCGIPLEVILWDDNERILKIENILTDRVLGQKPAVNTVCRALKNAYSGIRNPDKPIGSFVFGGQSGTGKTYMAKEMAKAVFGKDSYFIRLDMTEFSESHSVSKLVGSPPGYVGFQDTDVLIDKIKRKPYCLILLDELEKAHPDVMKLFLQVMSDGIMTDSSGNKADFKNVILIMTGNFGMDNVTKSSLGFTESDKVDPFTESQNVLIAYCKNKYGAEFINRVDEFVPFMPLQDADLKHIIKMRLEETTSRLVNRNCKLNFTDSVYDLLIKMSKHEHGKNAAVFNRLISKKVEPCISDVLMSMGKDFHSITIDVDNDQFIAKKKKENKESKEK